MKRILLVLSLLLIVGCSSIKYVGIEEHLKEDELTFKQDMLESIIGCYDEGTPIDSMYIPKWIK